jgi:Methyltransferase domain
MPLRSKLSGAFRARRVAQLRSLIAAISSRKGAPLKILDIGGRPQYWEQVGLQFLRLSNVKIVLLNIHATELGGGQDEFEKVVGDACDLRFADHEFDLVHSNSVIEHVETWRNMKAFASETRRVGRYYYVQTPYFWFPVDPHFYAFPMFHWLPRPIRARLLSSLPLATAGRLPGIDKSFQAVDDARLLDLSQFKFLFPDAEIRFERAIGLPKSMIALRGPAH